MTMLVDLKTARPANLDHLGEVERQALKGALLSFMDTASTATARATFYNTKQEQEAAVKKVHDNLFLEDRGVYGIGLLLPGVTDYSKQQGIHRLLAVPRDAEATLTEAEETALLKRLVSELPPQRVLNTFLDLKEARVNNARTRKLLLRSLLSSNKLEFWAVKYRNKLGSALEHAWSKRTTSILRSILAKEAEARDEKEAGILKSNIDKHLKGGVRNEKVYEAISFMLGNDGPFASPLFTSFFAAREDIKLGTKLPYEVLEGIRSKYHPKWTSAQVLELTKQNLTKSQKLGFQRKAKESKVEVDFNPLDYDPTRLYVYAYEMGMTDEVANALRDKAKSIADKLPFNFNKVGVLLDTSLSMQGDETQKNRPISVGLAIKDVLTAASDEALVVYTTSEVEENDVVLAQCAGATDLAERLVQLLQAEPDTIFVISDGYENAPSGRVHEILHLVRQMGNQTPVVHINPVMAAESKGVRSFGENVSTFPLNRPEGLGTGMLRSLIELDLEKGVGALLNNTLKLLKA